MSICMCLVFMCLVFIQPSDDEMKHMLDLLKSATMSEIIQEMKEEGDMIDVPGAGFPGMGGGMGNMLDDDETVSMTKLSNMMKDLAFTKDSHEVQIRADTYRQAYQEGPMGTARGEDSATVNSKLIHEVSVTASVTVRKGRGMKQWGGGGAGGDYKRGSVYHSQPRPSLCTVRDGP